MKVYVGTDLITLEEVKGNNFLLTKYHDFT